MPSDHSCKFHWEDEPAESPPKALYRDCTSCSGVKRWVTDCYYIDQQGNKNPADPFWLCEACLNFSEGLRDEHLQLKLDSTYWLKYQERKEALEKLLVSR